MKTDLLDIRHMDCMELMQEYPDNHFDLAIVDPPYGINAAKMTMGKGSGNDTGRHQKKDWDAADKMPPKEYFYKLRKISKNQIIWGGNYFLWFLQPTRCFLVWDKLDYNSDFADAELAWTSFDSNTKIFQRARSSGGDAKGKIHPTQKPVALYNWILQNYAKESDTILDTHLGSGSIAIACHYRKHHLTACELDEDYYNAACERIERETRQLTLF